MTYEFACDGRCSAARDYDEKYEAILAQMQSENDIRIVRRLNEQLDQLPDPECSCEQEAEPDNGLGEFGFI